MVGVVEKSRGGDETYQKEDVEFVAYVGLRHHNLQQLLKEERAKRKEDIDEWIGGRG